MTLDEHGQHKVDWFDNLEQQPCYNGCFEHKEKPMYVPAEFMANWQQIQTKAAHVKAHANRYGCLPDSNGLCFNLRLDHGTKRSFSYAVIELLAEFNGDAELYDEGFGECMEWNDTRKAYIDQLLEFSPEKMWGLFCGTKRNTNGSTY